MAEDIQYASVVFKNKKPQPKAKQEDETVYDEVKVNHKTSQKTSDANVSGGLLPEKEAGKQRKNYALCACCFGALSLVLVLSIIGVCLYVALFHKSDINNLNMLKTNQTILQKENDNLTNLNDQLKADVGNLTIQFDNLTKTFTVLENKISNLTLAVQNLTSEKEELVTENQELQLEKKNLTQRIDDLHKTQNELGISLAQSTVDAYCPKDTGRKCKSCPGGWLLDRSSCYAYNDADPENRRTWEGARSSCREKISDLTAAADETEKSYVISISPVIKDIKGYWIGLRAEGGKWKWTDGSNLTNQAWMNQPANDGQCVTSLQGSGWKSVSCEEKNAWICEKKAISL